MDPWTFIDYFNYTNSTGSVVTPWCHNALGYNEKTSTGKSAHVIYAIIKTKKKSDVMEPLGPSGPCFNGYLMPFPTNIYDQKIVLIYKEYDPARTGIITTEGYNWFPLYKRIPGNIINVVNPCPLVDLVTNNVLIQNNKKYLIVRFMYKNKESLRIMYISASEFIWDDPGMFYKSLKIIHYNFHIEDPFFSYYNGLYNITAHASNVCGSSKNDWNNCGVTLVSKDLIHWSKPKSLYTYDLGLDILPDTSVTLYRQRPSLYLGSSGDLFLLTSVIFNGSFNSSTLISWISTKNQTN
jgi:hypothetical protein